MGDTRAKILYLIPQIVQGGAERQLLTLMRRLPVDRFEPALCVFEPASKHYHALLGPGEPRADLGGDGAGLRSVQRFREVLRRERPALVHSFMDRANFVARVAAHLEGGPPVITSVRGPMMQIRYLSIERALSRWGARIVTNSAGIRRELTLFGRVPDRRIDVIPNIVDLSAFHPPSPAERRAARAKFAFPEDARVAVMAAWLGLAKNHHGLALAIWRARRAGILPRGTQFVFAGRHRDATIARILPATIRALGIGDLCSFLGPVAEMPALYAAGDVAVLPSFYEGLSNFLLEAQACGLPTVVSRAANRDDVVENGVTGFVVPTARTGPLADALGKALALSPDERACMGSAARERVLARFDPDNALAAVVALYDSVLSAT